MRHTAHGYWLDEAGAVDAAPSLSGSASADVVVIGGGYAGLWTAWQLRARGASVVLLEDDVCGHGPSGRNGGFCETLWAHLPSLAERFGRERGMVRRAGRRRLVPPGRLRDGLDGAGARRARGPHRGPGAGRARPAARPRRAGRPLRLATLPARRVH